MGKSKISLDGFGIWHRVVGDPSDPPASNFPCWRCTGTGPAPRGPRTAGSPGAKRWPGRVLRQARLRQLDPFREPGGARPWDPVSAGKTPPLVVDGRYDGMDSDQEREKSAGVPHAGISNSEEGSHYPLAEELGGFFAALEAFLARAEDP